MSKFIVLLPATPSVAGAETRLAALKAQQGPGADWRCWVIPGQGEGNGESAAQAIARFAADDRVAAAPVGLDSLARLMNWAAGLSTAGATPHDAGGDYIVALPDRILPRPDALAKYAAAFESSPRAAAAYSSYFTIHPDGSRLAVELHPHEGAVHERFDFGFLKAYRADALRALGGYREDLRHAAEYDVDLRLGDEREIILIPEYLYDVEPAPADEADSGPASNDKAPLALHSPGKGKLGGFSYIFYPPEMEAEVTGVFEETLRRRKAWIEHPTVPVPYPPAPYPVLATVVIPVLNRARFIANAIERVLEGTFQDFEIIVVDNGSTDGTQAVVAKIAARDSRVRLIQRAGGSIAEALNEGIRAAGGKYICQLDSDDEYKPDTLELMVGHMESHLNCGLAISYYELMDEDRGEVAGIDPITHSGYTRNQILRRDGAGALRVFPKVVLEEMGYYDEANYGNFGEDYDMVLKVGEKYDVDRVHKVLYRYRRHADNTDVTRDPLMKVRNKNNARLDALRRRQGLGRKPS